VILQMLKSRTYEIKGTVQGVGFRPLIYRLAVSAGLGGWVKNTSGSVVLCLQGEVDTIDSFISSLAQIEPPAEVLSCKLFEEKDINHTDISAFRIEDSSDDALKTLLIPADIAMCKDCEKDIMDPVGRRSRYPFTTCSACGPRYTVINAMPYDRERTTMSVFSLCPDCSREYNDPSDRRFHAESIACPVCGPRIWLADHLGRKIPCSDALATARAWMEQGKILALKGIGGFQIAGNAFNEEFIENLRKRKRRPHKPLAVMAANLDIVRKYCRISDAEEVLLKSSAAPIVILEIKDDVDAQKMRCFKLLNPDTGTLGVMLPYSPLHKLLFASEAEGPDYEMLVMTSGNHGGEPICIKNNEAMERLSDIVDFFLFHDREINLRNDDSIAIVNSGIPQVWRRGRGYAPVPVIVGSVFTRNVLSMGAEMKNTVAFAYDHNIVLSPHIGDLDTPEAVESLEKNIWQMPEFLDRKIEAVAVDFHPDLHSSVLGRQIADRLKVPFFEIQHHHAHAASCMAENGIDEALALVFDGTGLGLDGNIWGAEILEVKGAFFKRLGSFEAVPIPGGDSAVREPVRQLAGRIFHYGFDEELLIKWQKKLKIDEKNVMLWQKQCRSGVNSPLTHAAGRLYDSFAVLCGLTDDGITYDGQAAVRLEATALRRKITDGFDGDNLFSCEETNGMLYVNWKDLFARYLEQENFDIEKAAIVFHNNIAEAAVDMLRHGLDKSSVRNVVLSGGVFMNRLLCEMLSEKLKALKIKIFFHRNIPPNDGGISAGQAFIVSKILTCKNSIV